MSLFTRIKADDPNLSAILNSLQGNTNRFDYNALAREFNATDVGGLLQFEFSASKLTTIVNQLQKRGLQRDKDFTVNIADVKTGDKAVSTAFVNRLSDASAQILPPAPRAARKPKVETPKVTPVAEAAPAPAAAKAAPAPAAKPQVAAQAKAAQKA